MYFKKVSKSIYSCACVVSINEFSQNHVICKEKHLILSFMVSEKHHHLHNYVMNEAQKIIHFQFTFHLYFMIQEKAEKLVQQWTFVQIGLMCRKGLNTLTYFIKPADFRFRKKSLTILNNFLTTYLCVRSLYHQK